MRRRLTIFLATLTVVVAPSAAAQPVVPDGVAAVVHKEDGSTFASISEAQFDRFLSYAHSQKEQRPISKTVPLDAPTFDRCAASTRWFDGGVRPNTAAARRRACERRYRGLANTALQQILNLTWIALEADLRRIVLTERRIARHRREVVDAQFGGARGYARFLRTSGLSEGDIRLNLVSDLQQRAIVRQVDAPFETLQPSPERQDAEMKAIDAFREDFLRRSHAQTACAPAFASLPACTGEET